MRIRKYVGSIMIFFVSAVVLIGCASVPKKASESPGVVFEQPLDKTRQAAMDAIGVFGFEITKQEPSYVEGFRPRKMGLFVGSGGETIGVWLESLAEGKTRVIVETAKSIAGIVGQKDWDDEVINEMRKNLR